MLPLIISIAVVSCLYTAIAYNALVKRRNMKDEAWSGVDVQLKRRYELIPNLVSLVKAYSKHESELLEKVTALRAKSQQTESIAEKSTVEQNISADVKHIIGLVEQYPNLKADKNFRELHNSLVAVEDDLQHARRYYNGSVRNFNISVESFPSNLIAKLFGFHGAEFFEIDRATESTVPQVEMGSMS